MNQPQREAIDLIVHIDAARNAWYVLARRTLGDPMPLLRSLPGDLDPYVGLEIDEQVSFLRHRLAGVLQRAYDRLWEMQLKTARIIFVLSDYLQRTSPATTERLAVHFHEWFSRPPVWFLRSSGNVDHFEFVAMDEQPDILAVVRGAWPTISSLLNQPELWTESRSRNTAD